MDPQIINDQIVPSNPNRKKFLWLGSFTIVIFLLITATFVVSKTNLPGSPAQPSSIQQDGSRIVSAPLNRQETIFKITSQAFTSSATKNVITYVKLATVASNPNQSYDLYKKAFLNMSQAYKQTKNIKYKYVMIDLKTYLSTFPQYNAKELVMPQ